MEVKPISQIKPKIEDFTFGIECENYVSDWRVDHSDTHETISRVFNNFNGVLIFMRNIVNRHKDDEEFILHSSPPNKSSTCSAHIHLKCNIPEWNVYKYHLYERLYSLVKIYNVFFKNSPCIIDDTFSKRHKRETWAILSKLSPATFHNGQRSYSALTLNPGFDTIEFRYNEIPKHLNQLALYYYLVKIAIDDSIDIPELSNTTEIHNFKDLTTPLNKKVFSYKNKSSIDIYGSTPLSILKNTSEKIGEKNKEKFYNFFSNDYLSFSKWIATCLDYDLTLFKNFFDKKMNYEQWSEDLKGKFCKPIKKVLIK